MLLTASGITVGFGARTVLSSVDVDIEPGSITVFVGPNGSGKTTLLRCLAGALRPWKGNVTIGEDDVYRLPSRKAASVIAYVAQETQMPFAFTVGELVGLSGGTGGNREDVEEAMVLMDLGDLRNSALNSLSGGEQQRAAIALGLARQTPCLLLDEPTAHLDLRHQSSLFQALRLRARASRTAVVIVLHDLVQAARYADKMVLLCHGQVAKQGAVQEVITTENIEKVYRTRVRVWRDISGIVAVTPADDLTFS